MPARSTRRGPRPDTRMIALVAVGTVLASILATAPALATQGSRLGAGSRSAAISESDGALFDGRSELSTTSSALAMSPARRALVRSLGPQGVFELDARTGTPKEVARLDGYLTGPSSAAPSAVALGYVRSHLAAFGLTPSDLRGLTLVRDYVDVLGTHHLIWEQRYRGVPAFDDDLRANVTADGRLINVLGSPVHDLRVPSVTPRTTAQQAIAATYRSVGASAPALALRRVSPGPQRAASFRGGDDAGLVLFGTGRGAVLGWRTTSYVSSSAVYVSIVDATSGKLLWRANMVRSDSAGTGLAWEDRPGVSVPNGGGAQHQVTFPVAGPSELSGNNAVVFPDANDDDHPDAQVPASSGLDWSYPASLDTSDPANGCSPLFPCSWIQGVPFSWQQNVQQDATQVYHFLNLFHDHLLAAPIGFTEAAGNFQVVNASGQGVGGDPVVANVDDGADTANTPGLPDALHSCNANMATLPDGKKGHMQMYLFSSSSPGCGGASIPSSNGGDDASVVFHEYTHGLSSRLITLADGTQALDSAQSGAMGEAWSDWYAMDFLVNEGFEVDGPTPDLLVGQYVSGGTNGFIRSEPIDCGVGDPASECPGHGSAGSGGYTYGDFGRVCGCGPEVHSDGEIWGQTLWDIRTALGSATAETLITRGMELSPPEPSFLDARNAIIQADLVAFDGADVDQLWQIFAARGMGFFAGATDGGDVHPVQDFSVPPVCPSGCGTVRGTVTDAVTGAPVAGVVVGLAGHVSGLANDLADVSNTHGRYVIADVPFHTYELIARADGYEPSSREVRIDRSKTVDATVIRDWAALSGGAKLLSFTKPDYTQFGCGPADALDASLGTGWGSNSVTNGSRGPRGPRSLTVKLAGRIDVASFGVASNGTCGDGPSAAVKGFTIQTRSGHGPWITAVENSKSFPLSRFVRFVPTAGSTGVTQIRFTMRSNRGDRRFMDMLEISVRGTPA